MAKDFIKVLQEIRGTGTPEATYTDGIYWDLTIALHNGEPGKYGDILKMYSEIVVFSGSYDDFIIKYNDFLIKYADFETKYPLVVEAYDYIQIAYPDIQAAAISTSNDAASALASKNASALSESNSATSEANAKASEDIATQVLAMTATATEVSSSTPANASYDSGTGVMSFDIPAGIDGKNFIILGQKTTAEIDLLTPTVADIWQTTDAGLISGIVFNSGDLAYGVGTGWVNIGPIAGGSGSTVKFAGAVLLTDSDSTATLTDDILGSVPITSTGFPTTNPGVTSGSYYKISADSVFNGVTGVIRDYAAGDIITYVEGNSNPWVSVTTTDVYSFNGRIGTVTPQAGDYTKAEVGLANVDNTSDANKPVSTSQQTAMDAKVTFISNSVSISSNQTALGSDDGTTNGNIAIGDSAGANITSGDFNVLIGLGSGQSIITGVGNTLVGDNAGGNTTGSNNTFVGAGAGSGNLGSGNVLLGQSAAAASVTNNELHIANNSAESLIQGNFTAKTVDINGDLNVTGSITKAGVPVVRSSVALGGTGSTVVDNIVGISQVDYDALPVKDPNTYYLITV